ncbi:MAG: cyclase family protein [Planctomycetota bacterium]|nr:cyclase family protein [Planctomycetota bacterium]
MSRIIDISPTIQPKTAVWPGDVSFSRNVCLDMKDGANLTLSSMTSTLHIGAHADAPNHYKADGQAIDECPLEPYYGPCQVITVNIERALRIHPNDLSATIAAPRVLLRTQSFPDPNQFNEDFNSLSPELVEALHDQGVVLIGIDTPSIDPFSDKDLASHNAIARAGIRNLEGLILDHVEDGLYTLLALPLKIAGADASPIRAALIT